MIKSRLRATYPYSLGTHAHAAFELEEAIPLVQAEKNMIEAVWPGPVITNPLDDPSQLHCILISTHGGYDKRDTNLAHLYIGPNQILDFNKILQKLHWPPLLFLSACLVGQMTDDPDGDPMGLMGAFFMRGVKTIIASLQPVSDVYMPILSALFYETWINQKCDPAIALREAKQRLQTGDWYPQTEQLVRNHYPLAMTKALRTYLENSADQQLINTTHSWPYPLALKEINKNDIRLNELKQALRDKYQRTTLVNTIVENLIAQRKSLPVDHIVTWVRCFGV